MLRHERIQHPVGHGFFHSGELSCGNVDSRFTWVVDCGGQGPKTGALHSAVERYVRWHAPAGKIDLLFLTHLHSDHVNGLPELMRTHKPNHVVLPYLTPSERLALYVELKVTRPGTSEDPLDVELLVDPAARLRNLGAEVISFIRHEGEGPVEPPAEPEEEGNRQDDDSVELRVPPPEPGALDAAGVFSRTDRGPWTLQGNRGRSVWTFVLFVQDASEARLRFEAALKKHLPTEAGILTNPGIPSDLVQTVLKRLIRSGRIDSRLKRAYEDTVGASQLNRTSLSVLSCPTKCYWWRTLPGSFRWPYGSGEDGVFGYVDSDRMCPYAHRREPRGAIPVRVWSRDFQPGWLGTGDTELVERHRATEFLRHFEALLDRVSTLALPHHGSIHNYHPIVVDRLQPGLAYACTSARDRKHPHPDVALDLRARGVTFDAITEDSVPLVQRFTRG